MTATNMPSIRLSTNLLGCVRQLLRGRWAIKLILAIAFIANLWLVARSPPDSALKSVEAWLLLGPAVALFISAIRARLFELAEELHVLRIPAVYRSLPQAFMVLVGLALLLPSILSGLAGSDWLWLLTMAVATLAVGMNLALVLFTAWICHLLRAALEYAIGWPYQPILDQMIAHAMPLTWMASLTLLVWAVRRDVAQWQALQFEPHRAAQEMGLMQALFASPDSVTEPLNSAPDASAPGASIERASNSVAMACLPTEADACRPILPQPNDDVLLDLVCPRETWLLPRWLAIAAAVGALGLWLLSSHEWPGMEAFVPGVAFLFMLMSGYANTTGVLNSFNRDWITLRALTLLPGAPRNDRLQQLVLARTWTFVPKAASLVAACLIGFSVMSVVSDRDDRSPVLLSQVWLYFLVALSLLIIEITVASLIWFRTAWNEVSLLVSTVLISVALGVGPMNWIWPGLFGFAWPMFLLGLFFVALLLPAPSRRLYELAPFNLRAPKP